MKRKRRPSRERVIELLSAAVKQQRQGLLKPPDPDLLVRLLLKQRGPIVMAELLDLCQSARALPQGQDPMLALVVVLGRLHEDKVIQIVGIAEGGSVIALADATGEEQ